MEFYAGKWRTNMKNIFQEFNGNFIVAEREVKLSNGEVLKTVVGTMGWFYRDNMTKIELSSFSVAAMHRKCGIGRQLIEYIHNIADSRKMDVFLTTTLQNVGACNYYRRNGYREEYWGNKDVPGGDLFWDGAKSLGFYDVKFTRTPKSAN